MSTSFDKLHLGCGVKYIPGFYHVDALAFDHLDHQGPVDDLPHIPDNSSALIYACHLLEHFSREGHKDVLAEWYRVLKPGGVLRIAVPDFRAAAELYLNGGVDDIVGVMGLVCGGQRDEYDYHKVIFDEPSLSATLKSIGFSETRLWDWRTTEHSDMDDYSQAYVPHMDKENGRLVSLNLEAVK